MDFISTFLSLSEMNINTVFQLSYVAIFMWLLVIYMPKRDKELSEERQLRDDKFLEIITSYRDALTDFQEKENQSHSSIIHMIAEHENKATESHKQVVRILRAIADKLDASIYEE